VTVLFLLCLSLGALPARANDQTNAAMIAAAERVAANIDTGGVASPKGAFADHDVTSEA
jgi:hypothetical protein